MRLALFLAALLTAASPVLAQTRADPETGTGFTPKPLVTARHHMIVTAHPLATSAGAAMLDAGGSAADAAIAALLVLNLVEPQSAGIGGGAFALVHGPDGLTSWDARETAPAGATSGMFLEDAAPLPFLQAVASGRSVGVPGLVRLFETLHQRHGKLAWPDLFGPAIALARDGFPASPRFAASIERYADRLSRAQAARLFLPAGKPPAPGELFKNLAFADTLQMLASNGADAFYTGPLADQIVAAVRDAPRPGTLGLDDLATYRVIERPAPCMPFQGLRVCGMGPPSSGATTVGQILGLMDRFDIRALPEDTFWHLFAEASRLAYADRARYLADSDHVRVPVKGLLDTGYIADRARLIDPDRAARGKATAGDPPWREGRLHAPDLQADRPGTTHLSVIDRDGLAISLTASIETAFGSGRLAGGFLLNNQLTDFSFRPATPDGTPIANAPAPGKRPRSSMAPTIVYDGDRPVVLTGSPGGSRIPEYVATSLLRMLVLGLDPATAAAQPHLSHRNRGTLTIEPALPQPLADALAARGHDIDIKPMTSGLHIITIGPEGMLTGGADPRREGLAAGQ